MKNRQGKTKKLNAKKTAISISFGLASYGLSFFSLNMDSIFNIKLVWSLVFPMLISVVWGPIYTLIAIVSGPVFIPFQVDSSRGFTNFFIAVLFVLWGLVNSLTRNKVKQKAWYYIYIVQGAYVLFYVVMVNLLYKNLLLLNRYYWNGAVREFVSDVYIQVSLINDVMTVFMIMAIVQVLLQLNFVRRFLGLEPFIHDISNNKYFLTALLFTTLFVWGDSWMDSVYSKSRGTHLSFLKLTSGENIKTGIVIFFVCICCHYIMISSMARERDRVLLARMNNSLEKKVKQRTIELQQAYNNLESFSYTVSHELKTPIRELEAYIEIIEEDNKESLSEETQEDFNRMKKVCSDTIDLVKQMMEYAKAGYINVNYIEIDLNKLIDDCISEFVMSMSEINMAFVVKQLPVVKGDVFLLRQVIFNILSNAYKFTLKSNKPKLEIWADCVGETKKVYFRDNGVGFNPEYSEELFGVFSRLHNENEFEGKGIGLATVKKIMERHNGEVGISGEENKGCTVFLGFNSLDNIE